MKKVEEATKKAKKEKQAIKEKKAKKKSKLASTTTTTSTTATTTTTARDELDDLDDDEDIPLKSKQKLPEGVGGVAAPKSHKKKDVGEARAQQEKYAPTLKAMLVARNDFDNPGVDPNAYGPEDV